MKYDYTGLPKKGVGGVYKIQLDKTIYIGQTKDFRARWLAHCSGYANGKGNKKQTATKPLIDAGARMEVLEIINDKQERRIREDFYIKLFKDLNYNVLNVNEYVKVYQYDEKGLVRVYDKCKDVSEYGFSAGDVNSMLRGYTKKRGWTHKGYVWSDHELTIKEVKSRFKNKYKKTVYQYTLDGELIRVWDNPTEVVKHFHNGTIYNVLNGSHSYKNHIYKDYIWLYKPI